MLVIRHAELVSASHSEPVLVFHSGQMLKLVQHDEMITNMRRGNVGTSEYHGFKNPRLFAL
jgi:hypothetical protein